MSQWSVQITKVANMGAHKMLRIYCEIPQEWGAKFIETMGWPTEEKPIAAVLDLQPQTEEKTAEDCTKVLDKPLEKNAGSAHNAYSRRAGMLSSNKMFWKFIEAIGDDPATFAAAYIRNQCKVRSRADIVPGTDAAALFDSLELAFKLWENRPRYVETA